MAEIKVGISDLNVATKGDTLVTFALGSCVGICIYDSVKKIAGLSHIMLPNSTDFAGSKDIKKYADTAIPELIRQMELRGAKRICMSAKIAGGARMFKNVSNNSLDSIGDRNIVAVKKTLAVHRIPIRAEDTGLDFGRTQYFSSENGVMTIKSVKNGMKNF